MSTAGSTLVSIEAPSIGADVIADAIAARGLKRVFVFPGGTIAPILDKLQTLGIELFVPRHEQGAGYAALACGPAARRTPGRHGHIGSRRDEPRDTRRRRLLRFDATGRPHGSGRHRGHASRHAGPPARLPGGRHRSPS